MRGNADKLAGARLSAKVAIHTYTNIFFGPLATCNWQLAVCNNNLQLATGKRHKKGTPEARSRHRSMGAGQMRLHNRAETRFAYGDLDLVFSSVFSVFLFTVFPHWMSPNPPVDLLREKTTKTEWHTLHIRLGLINEDLCKKNSAASKAHSAKAVSLSSGQVWWAWTRNIKRKKMREPRKKLS